MTNIATLLKSEISRIARKQSRAEVEALKKTASLSRSEMAALKRRVQELEKAVNALTKVMLVGPQQRATAGEQTVKKDAASKVRFSAKGMASNRKRLNLSAADYALLIGTTEQSVYAWEHGPTQPRAKFLEGIAALRGVGKREVGERLEKLKSSQSL